jgi:hypothetical protein
MATTVWATRSPTVGTPRFRTPPLDFGISTSFTGGGKYEPEDNRFHVTYSLFRRSASKSSTVHPSTPGPPLSACTFLNASTTACFEIANGLPADFGSSTELLPTFRPVDHRKTSRMSRPLGSRPITGPSQLLRDGPPACEATVLSLLRFCRLRCSLSPGHSLDQVMPSPAFQRSLRKPQIRFTPPLCRTPPGQYMGTRQTYPGFWNPTRF